MLQKLVAWALSARIAVAVLALLIAGAGVWAFVTLPIDAFPDIAPTQVKIILKAPGMTPEEVETRVITPIETELLGAPDKVMLRSVAKYGIADITIDFADGSDIYFARQQVAERLSAVRDQLPAAVAGGLAPASTPLSDIFMFTVEGPLDLASKRTLLDWTIRPALRSVAGVADVNALGGRVESFEVRPDPQALAAAGLTVADLRTVIMAGNRNDGAGRLAEGEEALIVRVVGAIRSHDDLREQVIKSGPAGVVRLGDVASVAAGSVTRYGAVSANGTGEAVQGIVVMLRGADAARVVGDVRTRLAELQPSLPPGVSLKIFYDRSDLIDSAVGTVEKALIEATILVVILLFIFLGNIRAALIVAVTLPMAALITFLAMRSAGLTANLMSLGGLAIAIGILVDGAVVVVENAVERLERADTAGESAGSKVLAATSEVIVPVSAGILIIALVFLPLLSLQGLEGKLFAPVALTIIFALAGALLLALTLVPVLAAWGLKPGHHADPWIMRQLTPRYARLLDKAFAKPQIVAATAAAALVLAGITYPKVGKTFMPVMDEGAIIMQTMKLPSINLDRSVAVDLAAERAIMARVPEVTAIITRTGSDEIGLDPMGLNEADGFLTLKPRAEWRQPDKAWLTEQIRAAMADLPGVEPSFTQPIEMRVSEMLTGSRGDLAVKIFGPDLAILGSLAGRIEIVLRSVPGAADVQTVANDNVAYLQLDIDRLAIGRAGLSTDDFEDALRMQVEGMAAGTALQGRRRIPVIIRAEEAMRQDAEAFAGLQMRGADGQLLRVSDVATLARIDGPVKIEHENGSRFALVQAFVSGRDLVGYVKDAKASVASKVPLPPGYTLVWGGQFENQQRAAQRLMIVVPAALAMILLVLFASLRAVRPSLLVIANLPFAMVGGITALWLAGEYLSVPASVGFIALLGIAVLNGLVMVTHFAELRYAGVAMLETVRRGAVRRLRPVLMTASIAAFGLVPLLFATGPGSEIQRPLAIVVIGGLITATLATLVLLPLLYERFGERRA